MLALQRLLQVMCWAPECCCRPGSSAAGALADASLAAAGVAVGASVGASVALPGGSLIDMDWPVNKWPAAPASGGGPCVWSGGGTAGGGSRLQVSV